MKVITFIENFAKQNRLPSPGNFKLTILFIFINNILFYLQLII